MFGRIRDIVTIVNYCAFCVILVISTIAGYSRGYLLMIGFFVFLTVYTVRTYFLTESFPVWRAVSVFADFAAAGFLCWYDVSSAALCLYVLLSGDIILNFGKKAGTALFIADYLCFSLSLRLFFHNETELFVSGILIGIPVFALIAIIFLLIKYQIEQNEKLEAALKKLTVSKLETETLYTELKTAYEKAQDSAARGERNRIAREIHDTVGHTLTTALIELEAAEKLLPVDIARAAEKLNLAQQQVRSGLNDIRRSVRTLENDTSLMDFFDSVDSLLNDCAKSWGGRNKQRNRQNS